MSAQLEQLRGSVEAAWLAVVAWAKNPQAVSPAMWFAHLQSEYARNPGHVIIEAACIIFIVYLVLRKPYNPKKEEKLSKKEEEELIREWQPQPLVPVLPARMLRPSRSLVVTDAADAHVHLAGGREVVNFASYNFVSLANCAAVKAACEATIRKYGVGSCGPRGFYGTIDTHLEVEKRISTFLGTDEAILYSDGLACVSSVIPAFCKAGDLIIADEGVNFHVQQGLLLSRSDVKYFKHNDMADLERVLREVAADDAKLRRKLNRRFIVVEGVYFNHGDLVDLPRVCALKKEFKYRLVIDDSMAFGVLGATGRGTHEHFGVPIGDIEIYCATLDAALATCGGFCAGSHEVCNHQRLSGAGYCFSAASPPYSATAATVGLDVIDAERDRLATVARLASSVRAALKPLARFEVCGSDVSPLILLRLRRALASVDDEEDALLELSDQLLERGIVASVSQFIPQELRAGTPLPRPSLRIIVCSHHSPADVQALVAALKELGGGAVEAAAPVKLDSARKRKTQKA